ncbi:MAG: carboxypeptidase regulatory-like domain-containing protein, partial [Flexistipes sinusarabici]
MKRFVVFFLLLLFVLSNLNASENNPLISLYNMFPKMTELKGGSSRWIATGVVHELYDNYVRLESTYNYFSDKTEKIWDIKRDKNYSVDVKLFFAKDNKAAVNLYENMMDKRKSRFERDVKFGDEGRIFVRPVSVVNMISEYNLFFREENFIVHLHTFDGFALMDFADFFQKKVNSFVLSNIDMYVFKNFRLKASQEGYIPEEEELTVEADNASAIEISGRVTDEEGNPVSGVSINVLGHNKTVVSNAEGKYSVKFVLSEKGEKREFKTNFTLVNRKGENNKNDKVKMYKMNVKYPEREETFYLRINLDKNSGEIYIPSKGVSNDVNNIVKQGDYLEFKRNCTPEGSLFRCRQTYSGLMKASGFNGNWKGTGGKGTFKGIPMKTSSKKYNISETDFCSIKTVPLVSDNLSGKTQSSDQLYIDQNHGIALKCSREGKDFFIKNVQLQITKQASDEKFLLYKYKGHEKEGGISLKGKTYIGVIGPNDDFLGVDVFLMPESLQEMTVLAGDMSKKYEKTISFAAGVLYPARQPKLIVEKFITDKAKQNVTDVSVNLKKFASEKDVASDKGTLGRDGKRDMSLELKIKGIGGDLKAVELSHKGENSYVWNTEPFDIYPAVALFANGDLINQNSGEFNFPVDNGTVIDIFIHKPEYLNSSDINMTYKILIGKKWYSGRVE